MNHKLQSWLAGRFVAVQYPAERQQPPRRRMSLDSVVLRLTVGGASLLVLAFSLVAGAVLLAFMYYVVRALFTP